MSGSKKYKGFDIQANIDLTPTDAEGYKRQQPDQTSQPNISAEGTYQLDDICQEVRATVGPGEIIIRDKDKQTELEASGQTEDLASLNRDPDKAYEITKDKHVEIEFYLSDSSVKAALEAGVAITEIMGDLLNRLSGPALSAAIRNQDIDPADAIKQLQSQGCLEQRTQLFNILEWVVPSAHAASCQIKTLSGC